MTDRASVATAPTRIPASLHEGRERTLQRAVSERWASRIWERDTGVWTSDGAVAGKIANRLGWLDAPAAFGDRVETLEAFAAGVRAEGFTQAVVLGMGGSSLAPEVLALVEGQGESGIPVDVLDSTDPEAVQAIVDAYDPASTLYLVASKSGTTLETQCFAAYLWKLEDDLHDRVPDRYAGEHFVALTDPGDAVGHLPHADSYREVFLNPPDVGGRYSALTYVGLVPAALLGIDLRGLLGDGARMADRCRLDDPGNPGLELGATLGALARAGRDKLTLVMDPRLDPLGAWIEQLVAESTGKHGVGIVPVHGEPLGDPSLYGDDRVFVRLSLGGSEPATDAALEALAAAGHPVIDLSADPAGLGGEFFRWEFATAVAGAVLGIDPFDEPNVTESKENTKRVLSGAGDEPLFRAEPALAEESPLTVSGDAAMRLSASAGSVEGELRRHLARARPNGYVAIQAYIAPTDDRDRVLRALQRRLRDSTGLATTLGYGPRFLHSTGQLHKGGAPIGCFIQLVGGHRVDLPIPERDLTFGRLVDAQAVGDFLSLESHDLPVVRVHLSDDPDAGLAALAAIVDALPSLAAAGASAPRDGSGGGSGGSGG